MFKQISVALAIVAIATSALAQEKAITVADFIGTWNIEVMSHQIALVIDPQEGNKVTGTMMMMGRDTLLKGELSGRTITFTGIKTEDNGTAPAGADHQHPANTPPANAKPIVVTLLDDGTLSGEMMTSGGPVKWVGEKLKTKKKG